jgi:hypothetical protein
VDLEAGAIHVRASWDDVDGEGTTKTEAGVRVVPIIPALRAFLGAHLMATGRRGTPDALVFGSTDVDRSCVRRHGTGRARRGRRPASSR